jgi:hypothetical protein
VISEPPASSLNETISGISSEIAWVVELASTLTGASGGADGIV